MDCRPDAPALRLGSRLSPHSDALPIGRVEQGRRGTAVTEDAGGAAWPLRQAGAASVLYQGYVEGVDLLRLQECLEQLVGLLGAGLGRHQAEASGHAVDVGIDGQGGPAQGEEEHAGRGLGSDAGQAAQPGAGLLQGQVPQEGEVEGAPDPDDVGSCRPSSAAMLSAASGSLSRAAPTSGRTANQTTPATAMTRRGGQPAVASVGLTGEKAQPAADGGRGSQVEGAGGRRRSCAEETRRGEAR